MRTRAAWSFLAALVLVLLLASCKRSRPEVTVAAAASLRAVLPAIIAAFEQREPGPAVVVTYGASGTLRQQVEGGAPVDLVVFASAEPVDKLVQAHLVAPESRQVVARNRLVLVGPRGGAPITFATLAALGPSDQLAIGEPTSVPAGAYAERALKTQGVWDTVRPRLVFGGDVTAVLTYARRGEVRAAIVYATDVRGLDDVVVLDTLPEARAPRIEVVAGAVTAGGTSPRALALLAFLRSDEGQRAFESFGFQRP